jgi:hypothetical protein
VQSFIDLFLLVILLRLDQVQRFMVGYELMNSLSFAQQITLEQQTPAIRSMEWANVKDPPFSP